MMVARLMAWFIELRNRFNEPMVPATYVLNLGDGPGTMTLRIPIF